MTSWGFDSCSQGSLEPFRNGFLYWPHMDMVDFSGFPHVDMVWRIFFCLRKDMDCVR